MQFSWHTAYYFSERVGSGRTGNSREQLKMLIAETSTLGTPGFGKELLVTWSFSDLTSWWQKLTIRSASPNWLVYHISRTTHTKQNCWAHAYPISFGKTPLQPNPIIYWVLLPPLSDVSIRGKLSIKHVIIKPTPTIQCT